MGKTKEKQLWEERINDINRAAESTKSGYETSAGGTEAVIKSIQNVIDAINESGLQDFTLSGEATRTSTSSPDGEYGMALRLRCDQINCPVPPMLALGNMMECKGEELFTEPGATYNVEFDIDKENFIELLLFQKDTVIPVMAAQAKKPNGFRYSRTSWVSPVMGLA